MRSRYMGSLLLAALVAAQACKPAEKEGSEEAAAPGAEQVAQPDTTGAAMWAYLHEVDYQKNWHLWPDKGELYAGREPHGMLLTTYLNDAAYNALVNKAGTMPVGAIIVKENYMPDSTLAAVTTMFKVEGYNPEHHDWFFTKHLASGELDKMPNGMAMEGRLPGCQGCHGAQAENDYIYTSALK